MATLSIRPEHLDEVLSAYVEWRRHSQFVQIAYGSWSESAVQERALRYAAYLEELDREQRACELYAEIVARVGHA
jgi:hypothetical protein